MKLKRIFALVLSIAVGLTTVYVHASVTTETEEPVKYENELYHIGYDIPADSYLLIPKDNTKPAFVGVYSNSGNPKAELNKYYELSVGNEIDYVYPHYFDESEDFSDKTEKAIENVGKCLYSKYFEFVGCIDLSSERNIKNPSYNFLCLENCYAVSVKYADKFEWNPNNSGFMPVSAFYKKGKSYSVKVAENKPKASFVCYRYDKITGNIEPLTSCYVDNALYKQYTNRHTDGQIFTSKLLTIPKDTDIICKKDANIFDINGNLMYTDQNFSIPDNYTEKFNFADITPTYKLSVQQQLSNFNTAFSIRFFKDLTSSAKTDVDKEYCRYAREIGVISNGGIYNKMVVDRYFSNAASFKDLEQLLRYVVYLNPISVSGTYDANYMTPSYNLYYYYS